jgi:DNA-binding transcriptional ArsR family regulator
VDQDELDEALRALAHADRRTFLKACLTKDQAAGDLAALSHLSNATVSEHLKVLRKSGLLELDREGRFWLYRTNKKRLSSVARAIASLEE